MVPERCYGPQKENPTVQSDTSIHNHTMSPQIHLDKYLYKDFWKMYLLVLKKDLYLGFSEGMWYQKQVVMVSQTYTYLQTIKLYTLSTYSSFYVHHTSIKWFKNHFKT